MIKFFRKIRKKLVEDNRGGKYLLYAGGEILLIIIGVLIALTVAEWNGNRKDKAKEKAFLEEINASLIKGINELEAKIVETENSIMKISILDSLLKDKTIVNNTDIDTLFGAVFGLKLFSLEKSSFEDLKAEGLNLMSNESIRRQLINVFEKGNQSLETINDIEFKINDVVRPYYFENFNGLQIGLTATPNNFEAVWNDTYYDNLVDYRLGTLRLNQESLYVKWKQEIESLNILIEDFLGN